MQRPQPEQNAGNGEWAWVGTTRGARRRVFEPFGESVKMIRQHLARAAAEEEWVPYTHHPTTDSPKDEEAKDQDKADNAHKKKKAKVEEEAPKLEEELGETVLSVLMAKSGSNNDYYLDIHTMMNCCFTTKETYRKWKDPLHERAVSSYFRVTVDMKSAAENVVAGEWKNGWVPYLTRLARDISKLWRSRLGYKPPAIYRALMGQQAIRRIDQSPHPLLFGAWWHLVTGFGEEDGFFPSSWHHQIKPYRVETTSTDGRVESRQEPVIEKRVPSHKICFGTNFDDIMPYAQENIHEPGFLLLADFPPNHDSEGKVRQRLEQYRQWLVQHAPRGSLRQKIAAQGHLPAIFLACQQPGTYDSYWAITLDENDRPALSYIFPYTLHDDTKERPSPFFDSGLSSLHSWYFLSSGEDTQEWAFRMVQKYDLLAWTCMCKSLGICGFKDADIKALQAVLRKEGAFDVGNHYDERLGWIDMDPAKQIERLLQYCSSLELIF